MFKLLTFIVLMALLYNLVTGRPILPLNNKPSQPNDKGQDDDDYDDYQEID